MLTRLGAVVEEVTQALDHYNYTRALERTETCFWFLCDNYIELVKSRRYGDQGPEEAGSANAALLLGLSTFLRLFAPFMPFVTEEVWSWWREGSVHRAPWPTSTELLAAVGGADAKALEALTFSTEVLSEIRKRKSESQQPMRAVASAATVRDTPERLRFLPDVRADLMAAGHVKQFNGDIGPFEVRIELEPPLLADEAGQ
jgi:valyl-tRNA synthetase